MHRCPRDQSELKALKYNRREVLKCYTCDGLWLSKELITSVMNSYPKLPDSSQGSLICPNDKSKLFVLKHDGVEIDHCSKCKGIWLDGGEFQELLKKKYSSSSPSDYLSIKDLAIGIGTSGDLIFYVIAALISSISGL